ncbi:MFS transporter [Amycolatopsis acidicola]|uniref:MFS transporter n=1 Tax=Amycolatopsis acidicola TaxID=2596893 RepID=A0A5N0UR13_9PSEU|nr:MFS transporter [Amycolatopsis acidicola]KAA9149882.1 MFS transporter [Amycolatopsis acidicola]
MTHAIARPAGPEDGAKVRPGAIVAVLAFGGIVVSLMQTLIIPLVSELPTLLHSTASDATWAITATLLAAAVATPTMGRLGDMYGKRRMLLFSVCMLVIGSVVCALAGNLPLMVVGRALQGLASGVIPLGISIMRDELPPEKLGSAIALMSASLGIGGALGLPAAALIAQNFDWHVLFWSSAVLGAIAGVLAVILVPESKVRTGGRFDFVGALGLSVALLCLLLGISKGSDWGWDSGLTLGSLIAAVVVFLVWGWYELRTTQPLVDLRTTARRQVLLTNIASVVFGFAMFAMSLVLPQLLQLPKATGYGLGQTMVVAGLVLAPGGLLMMATAPVSAWISRTRGPKVTLMIGALIVAIGYGLSIMLMGAVWQVLIGACVVMLGIGLAYGAMPALVMGGVPQSETAAANSLNTLMRSLGTSFASAIAGVILASMTTQFGPVSVPSKSGFQVVLAISVGAALTALIIASFLPGRKPAPARETPVAQETPAVATPAAGGVLSGRLLTSAGSPVPNGVLTVTSADGHQVGRARAGADGKYTVDGLRPGAYTLIVTVAGFEPEAASVTVGPAGAVHDFELAGGGAVTGIVRRAPEGAEVPGAGVAAMDAAGQVVGSTQCADDGTFYLAGLPSGEITVVAQVPGHQPQALTVTITGQEPAVVDLVVESAGRLRGIVSGPDGRPLAEATVSVARADGELAGTTVTDAEGRYELRGLEPGEYTVVTSLYTPSVRHVSLTSGEQGNVDLDLGTANAEQATV